jgi:tetratricopeptide (TPR) repeat protein
VDSVSISRTADRAGDCLSDDDVAGMVAGGLSTRQRDALGDHMDACERCRRLVSALVGVGSGEPTEAADGSDAGLAPGQMLGRFTLIRLLGHGSMGEVWAARDQGLDREVALKLLRLGPGALDRGATHRLRREAQAMARLNHPNVVAVYELGTDDDDRVFCAMELVDGVTLRHWLATPRSWRAVIAVAIAVARGIEAAHAVGLIHRDIKPENILIASGGRPLVSDFGLARLADLGAGEDVASDDAAVALPPAALAELTTTGAVIGTPAYMAPEQLAGKRADARSDQFSYCVAIHEALFGERPFAGATLDELAEAIRRGPRQVPLGGVPRAVARCLARGLAADPAARWPSMTGLIDELERATRRPRQRRIAAVAGGAAVLAVVGVALVAREPDRLAAARAATERRIAAAWNPATALVLRGRFAATGMPLAGERVATTTRLLDDYRAAWAAQRVDAWAATHLRGEQTAQVLERRFACFDRLADAMAGLVAVLLVPGVHDVEDAPQIVSRLDPIASCADLDRLLARSIAPSTPAGLQAERRLRELEVMQIAGRHAEVVQRATALVDTATQLGEAAVVARARYNLGWAQARTGHPVDAEATLRRAVQEAAAVRDHYLVAECWLQLLHVTGFDLDHLDVAAAIEPAARAAVAQAGDDPRQLADLAKALGLVAIARHDYATAQARFIEARDRHIVARGASDPSVASDEANLGAVLLELGHPDEAVVHFERVIAIIRGAYGEHHPTIAQAEHNLATIAGDRHDWLAAERHARAAVEMNVAVRGANHPDIAKNRLNLARILREQKKFVEARGELERARAVLQRSLPPSHPSAIVFDLYVAQLEEDEGHWDDAVRLARRVVDATRRAQAKPNLRFALAELARMVAHTSPRDALAVYDEVLRLNLEFTGRSVHQDAEVLDHLAAVALRADRPQAAIAWFDRMPEAAKQLTDTRRRLDSAAARLHPVAR